MEILSKKQQQRPKTMNKGKDDSFNQRFWCQYCKIFVYNNHVSIKNHEDGWTHKNAVSRFIGNQKKERIQEQRSDREKQRELDSIIRSGERSFVSKDGGQFSHQPRYNNNNNNQDYKKRKEGPSFSSSSSTSSYQPQTKYVDTKQYNQEESNQNNDGDDENNQQGDGEQNENDEEEEKIESTNVGEWESVSASDSMFGSSTTYSNNYDHQQEEDGYGPEDEEQDQSTSAGAGRSNKKVSLFGYQEDEDDESSGEELIDMNKRATLNYQPPPPSFSQTDTKGPKVSFAFGKKKLKPVEEKEEQDTSNKTKQDDKQEDTEKEKEQESKQENKVSSFGFKPKLKVIRKARVEENEN
ncbi:hypothetical protein DFA_01226 [Cavenderia fasciculata]|uniref:Matrin-type domain-containing protein n=1 Tax=Cavenderia fasciculata TaxID=261658 RepID=F4PRK5_CACFS|nr:uncharacterized protein DFA_01226 [Cavenderia fasciculata]EGG21345.1 hypothetical protein DFA_01226 [Cavenderia fasciculata]|eukprot:XP_004359195.1 hypothetical protein DFA_01226 [Cavenderia fasciculata]